MFFRRNSHQNNNRAGFSLLELLAVVAILSLIAIVIVPRVSENAAKAKTEADKQHKAEISSAVERWYFEKGTWPAGDLSDIGADANYFPNGIPTNPVSGAAYSLNATTHRTQ